VIGARIKSLTFRRRTVLEKVYQSMVFELLVRNKTIDFRGVCQAKMFAALRQPSKNQHPPKLCSDHNPHTQVKISKDQLRLLDLKLPYLEVLVIKKRNPGITNTNRMKSNPVS